MDYVQSHNIEIHNARGVYSIPMAEFAVCGVLQLYKQSRFFAYNQSRRKWEKHRGLLELYGKNVCIVGCGSVGTECAKRFKAFGCNVIGVDLFSRKDENYSQMLGMDKLNVVLSDSDIIILTVPLAEQTKYLINKERLSLLKSNTILVNIARGAIVDTNALVKILENNRIGGAVLDVFEEEPLDKMSLLWKMDNVLITPHNSFISDSSSRRLDQLIINNIQVKTI